MNGLIGAGRRLGWLLALAAAVGAAGCGSANGTVRGKVSYKGASLKGGAVTFFAADGKGFRTGIHEDGSYTLDRLPLGPVKVCVDTSSLDPKKNKRYAYAPPPGSKELPGAGPPGPEAYVAIPAKYADQTKTDLTYEVISGNQQHDIELK